MAIDTSLVQAAKMAKRITTDAYDSEVVRLLETAMLDLGVAGVEVPGTVDRLVGQAAITYFLLHFGEPENYDRLKATYDEQKAQLATCTGYTDWIIEPMPNPEPEPEPEPGPAPDPEPDSDGGDGE